jgi:Na+/H+-dicarboxylate symporter
MIEIKSLNTLSIYLDRLIHGRLWLKVIIGLILGVGLGILINPSSGFVTENVSLILANWLDLPGQIFMRLVQMIMIPLVFASIISGIVGNSSEILKTFGLSLLLYFVFTTSVAILIGLSITLIMKPGLFIYELGGFPNSGTGTIETTEQTSIIENIPNAISNLIPSNPQWKPY